MEKLNDGSKPQIAVEANPHLGFWPTCQILKERDNELVVGVAVRVVIRVGGG